jgi:hypothetical protein
MRHARRRLLALRLSQWTGSLTSGLVILLLGTALWLGGAWLYAEYVLRTVELALPELLDGRRYRYLSDAAIIDAAPAWARGYGVETKREWVRIGIDDGGFAQRAASRPNESLDAELRALGLAVGTRGQDARVQVSAKVVFEKRVFPFTIRRLAEGAAGTERSAAYRVTGTTELEVPDVILGVALITAEWWDEPPAGLEPLPPPLTPVVGALDAWRRTEQRLAGALGRPGLEAPGSPGARAVDAVALRSARRDLEQGRAALAEFLRGTGRRALSDWLGQEGAESVEAADAAMAHLDFVLAAAVTPGAAEPLVGPYAARARRVRTSLLPALLAVGVVVPE